MPDEKMDRTDKRQRLSQDIALFMVMASVQFVIMETYLDFPFPYMYPAAFFVSCLFFCALVFFLSALFRSMRAGFLIVGAVSMFEGIVSRYLMLFRGAPLMVSDISSIHTAAAVAGNYDFMPDVHMLSMAAASAAVMLAVFFGHRCFGAVDVWFGKLTRGVWRGAVLAGLAALFVLGFGISTHYKAMVSSNDLSVAYAVNSRRLVGTVYDFIGVPSINRLVAPDGYSDWTPADDAFDPIDVDPADMPDVVVIMNEAFSDPDDFGRSCATSEYMPFLNSFGDGNSRLGKFDVSVKAGNTANTEFEYLCGASMAYYTPRSVPYQYAIDRDIPSLARYFKAMGYETWAVHPSDGANWNRNAVYPMMGFDNCLFENQDCGDITFGPWSDRWDRETDVVFMMQDEDLYEAVQQILSKRDSDGVPRFIFIVTMQNHGGYFRLFEDLGLDVMIDEDAADLARPDDALAMVKYLSLMKKSDQAYEAFSGWLSDRKSDHGFDALTVFFGDHQPDETAHKPFTHAAGLDDVVSSGDAPADFYVVPYGMWATYSLPDGLELGRKSVNYGGIDLFDAVGRGCPEYYTFLREMSVHVPVQTGVRVESDGSDIASMMRREYGLMLWHRIADPEGWGGS